jgi:hypothetical protein
MFLLTASQFVQLFSPAIRPSTSISRAKWPLIFFGPLIILGPVQAFYHAADPNEEEDAYTLKQDENPTPHTDIAHAPRNVPLNDLPFTK